MFPIQSLGVECEVCLCHAGDLRWQNLFLVIVERAIIYTGAGKCDLCPMHALTQHLHVHGSITPSPLFLHPDGTLLNCQWLTSSSHSILSADGVPGLYTGHTASALAQLFQQPLVAYQITSPRHLSNGSRYVSDLYTHIHHYYCGGSRPTHLTQ